MISNLTDDLAEIDMDVHPLISFDHLHPHDLIFCEQEVILLNAREEVFCHVCSKSLAGAQFYYCGECYFFLHNTCADLPPIIKHPSHRKHTLILHTNSPYGPNGSDCNMCDLRIANFLYRCSDCDFDLDIDCAMLARCFIQPQSHKHHFITWCRSDPFTCDFCGTYSDRYRSASSTKNLQPWICTNCHVVVHNKCISLPFSIQLPQHDHPLIHTYFIPESQSIAALICKICCQEVKREFGCYSCQNCPCVVHVNCALDNVQEVGQKLWAQEIEAAEDQLVEQEIEHFSHPHHKLFMVQNHDDDHEIETKCDACMRIISFPFYKCLECDFSLHISCSKLPKQINHPLHPQHPLTLAPNEEGFASYCFACHNPFHGFSYRCRASFHKFRIDIRCALVNPLEFFHDSHKHPLSVLTQSNNHTQCTSCGKVGKADGKYLLRCKEQCPFALDYGCATLPHIAKYEYDENSLVLSYYGDDDSNGFPYCDICEQYRDPNLWFYGCPNYRECPIYVHPHCAHGDCPYLKLGTIVNAPNVHEHHLFFTLRKEDFLPCHLCSKKDQEISLECRKEDCNFNVHCYCSMHL
ncbi:uncharacterized protein LOC119989150 isoform X2 [Tripterygium wilfordii]|uniref:uncharacterized protein LOC119989150 isoform X2 n=1 Tax=Tripterygium wilfordii TaxID=458696 RepID=UPI0018F8455A|nr:uncharacterized protein LOC119989150 isoform X2 [Tripterygium wilfordii]